MTEGNGEQGLRETVLHGNGKLSSNITSMAAHPKSSPKSRHPRIWEGEIEPLNNALTPKLRIEPIRSLELLSPLLPLAMLLLEVVRDHERDI